MSAQKNFRPTNEVLAALVAAVTATQLPDAGGAAFEAVKKFDSNNLAGAFRELILNQQRACIIVPVEEKFESVTEGNVLTVKRTIDYSLIISDRVIGDRPAALFGSTGPITTPGAYALKDLVLPQITGQLLPHPAGVQIEPTDCYPITVSPDRDTKEEKLKGLPGRAAVVLEVTARGGFMQAQLADAPNI